MPHRIAAGHRPDADLAPHTVPYEGHFTCTFDALENTATYSGLHFRVHPAGEGVLALDVGREIVDLVNRQQIFFDGNQNLPDFTG
jgi:hypothetical protein